MKERRTILLVDGRDAARRALLHEVVEAAGHDVRWSPSTIELGQEPVPPAADLVILHHEGELRASELAIRWLRQQVDAPILLLVPAGSGLDRSAVLQALGASEVLTDPDRDRAGELQRWPREVLRTIRRLMPAAVEAAPQGPRIRHEGRDPLVIALGISTGGPAALAEMMPLMEPEVLPPLLIVQHIPADYVAPLAERLGKLGRMPVHVATDGETPRSGHAYIAPGDRHLAVEKRGSLRMRLLDEEPMTGHRPSADRMFHSLADARIPTLGVIMTGMGRDGAAGLVRLREQGNYVIGQDEASSVVYGMPRAAHEQGAVTVQLPMLQVPGHLAAFFRRRERARP